MIKQEALLNIGGKVIDIGRRIMVGAAEGVGDRRISEFSAELDHAAEMLFSLRHVASADTLPKGQDAQQGLAGTESGAVGATSAETPSPSSSPAAGR